MIEYELFFKYSMDMFVIAGVDGYFKRVNPALCNMLGRSEAELISLPFTEFLHPDDIVKVEGAIRNLSAGHPAFLVEVRLLASDNTYRQLQWTAYPDPKTGLLFAIAKNNITANFDSTRVKVLLDSSPTAVFLVEHSGIITYSNHIAEKIFGYEKNELIGKSIDILTPLNIQNIHKEHRSTYIASPVLRPMGMLNNLIGLRKDGSEFSIDVGLNPVWLDLGMIVICSVIDTSQNANRLNGLIREKKKLDKEKALLAKLAEKDPLTGLFNRRAFERLLMDNLHAAREKKSTISVIMMDIDRFKDFNDTFGHPAGDLLLKEIGELLIKNTRKADTAARIGGEEFMIIFPNLLHDEVVKFGERLRRVVELETERNKPITISLGVSTYQFTSKRAALKLVMKKMLLEADQALYESKKTGRNRLTHFANMPQKKKAPKNKRG